jgi:hypothetical protein
VPPYLTAFPSAVRPGSDAPLSGYLSPVIALYSRRLGCLGSLVLSVVLTAVLILLFTLL